ncbi:FAD synthase [Mycoplasmopsis gallopavonis]|uniref:FAD synthase n=1 Tax=Mycoplasmopsis gallopavonis TaxID=76629 RepID=A0A449B0A8_9BACT|nr:hypothetical protein [Mycoplasmopsis gallopavonis]RIV16457.1 hypothetical protein D1113_02260 [Mycoplasmopsis gallopavonis]VEU73200.1 riboflavin kinase [Mycoplasmopsis gallopavonis]
MTQSLLVTPFEQFKPQENNIYIIGAFESFHQGHYSLLKQAQKLKGRKILVTFDNDDLPNKGKKFTDNNAKLANYTNLPIDQIVLLEFSKIGLMEGLDFLQKLTGNLACTIIVGKNFACGRNAACKVSDIKNFLKNANVIGVDILKEQGSKISTSNLKEALFFGDLEFLDNKLIHNYTFTAFNFNSVEWTFERDSQITPIAEGFYYGSVIVLLKQSKMIFPALIQINKNNQNGIFLLTNLDENSKFNKDILKEFKLASKKHELLIEIVKTFRLIKKSDNQIITDLDLEKAEENFDFAWFK